MGIEPFLVSSALSLIIAQRLVRKICDHCKEPDLVSHAQLMLFGLSREEMDGIVPMRGRGCVRCHDTGYKGRLGLFEVLPLSESLHVKILERAPANDLKKCAIQSGVKNLRQNGLSTIKLGMTTVDEVLGSTVVDRLT
jgi:type IV pilus assembly protein PilB